VSRPRPLTGVAAAVLVLVLSGGIARPAVESHDASGLPIGVPTITAVLNNYSYILPGTPNYGIAPGSIFVIFGSGMATPGSQAVLQDSSKGLPFTLNGASVSVTVAGNTVYPALYYASPTQIAAVLPSTTPPGAGTVTVTSTQAGPSAPATIQVVKSALGLATMSGDGTGPVMATDANYNFISPTNSAVSGQIITLWGTGLGASPSDSDTTYTPTPHQITSVPLTIFFEGVQMPVVWAGRSGYPGLDQINVQLPVSSYTPGSCNGTTCTSYSAVVLPLGCSISLSAAAVDTGVGSNTVALPTSMAGGSCTLPSFVLDPGVAQSFGSQATVNFGFLSASQYAGQAMAGGSFESLPGSALAAFAGKGAASAGSCVVVPQASSNQDTDISAGGYVSVTGAAGQLALGTGDYANYGGIVPASTIPASGGMLTFSSPSAQYAAVGPFNLGVKVPAPLEWTNQNSIGGINRSQGVHLTWTGGDADGMVAIRGSSFAAAGSPTPGGSFMCSVPAHLGQFTVPASILQALPAGAGTLTVENQSAAQGIPASGLDVSYAFAGAMFTINAAYN
jgi:uncharacterized protein (TIGR03437 family)